MAAVAAGGSAGAAAPYGGARVVRFHVAAGEEPDKRAAVMVWALHGSCLVWVGPAGLPAQVPHLVSGALNRLERGPVATTVAGDLAQGGGSSSTTGGAEAAHGMAKRLALKCKQVVHVSCAVPSTELALLRAVERRVVAELEALG